MSEQVIDTEETPVPTELEELQARANLLGLEYDGRWGVEKMRAVVNAAVLGEPKETSEVPEIPSPTEELARVIAASELTAAISSAPIAPKEETREQRRYRKRKEATRLVRVHVQNMNPARKEWEGDTYTVSNSVIGTIKRYIPYNTDWHVEQALLNAMQERECQIFNTRRVNGQDVKSVRMIKELQIAILPPLTEKELRDLAQRQAMAAGTSGE